MAERERALLEEGIAQRGRLRAQLETAGHGRLEKTPARTSAAARTDDGGTAPPKPQTERRDGGER
jgi:hypothetical protein